MKLIDHPNIMRLYDVWETSTHLYLILEYVEGGELFERLCAKGPLSYEEALRYFQQIIAAVDYCHQFNIAHRDLKPENLLLDKNKNIKVADFGMAGWQSSSHNGGLLRTSCGSPHYAAPEVIMGQAYHGSMADIWSCGIILHALLTRALPFDDEDLDTLLKKVKKAEFTMAPEIDSLAQDLIRKMLQKDVKLRITIAEVMKHPFFLSRPMAGSDTGSGIIPSIQRPMAIVTSIDPDIFANLRTLWNGTPDDEIKERLQNEEKTWEKSVYWLLVDFKMKRRERIEQEREAEEKRLAYKAKKQKERMRMNVIKEETTSTTSPLRVYPPTPPQVSLPETLAATNTLSASSSLRSPLPSSPPVTPLTLDIPSQFMQDKAVHAFFTQIVDHLNIIQARGSPANLSSITNSGFMGVDRSNWSAEAEIYSPGAQEPLNSFQAPAPTPTQKRSRKGNEENQGVRPLTIQTTPLKNSYPLRPFGQSSQDKQHVQIIEPHLPLKHKKTIDPTSPSFSFSSGSNGPPGTPSSPKRMWFPFKTRHMTYTLMSFHSAQITRNECRRLLMNLGCNVVLIDAEGLGVLKCRLDDVKHPARMTGIIKGAKFRVDVIGHGENAQKGKRAEEGWEVEMRFMLEKGSLDTFRSVIGRVREEWVLDVEGMCAHA
jgi:serine/threonine-protein kinase HSL1 (negative regulator of Swe1 kinase)